MKWKLLIACCLIAIMATGCASYEEIVEDHREKQVESKQMFPYGLTILSCTLGIRGVPCHENLSTVTIPYASLNPDETCDLRTTGPIPRNTDADYRHLQKIYQNGKVVQTLDIGDCISVFEGEITDEQLIRWYDK